MRDKVYLVIFHLIFLSFPLFNFFHKNPVVLALDTYPDCPDATTYYTCHYQSGTGLTCPVSWSPPEWDQPFYSCSCWIDPHDYTCQKAVGVSCSNQTVCNANMSFFNNPVTNPCSRYGDCCFCSGVPVPTATVTPTPTATLTPTLTPIPNAPPSFVSLVIKNTAGTVIVAEN